MPNDFYAVSGAPATRAQGASSPIRAEFQLIKAGFDKLPTLTANGNKAVVINAGGTAMGVTAAALALAIAFTTAGSGSITLTGAGATNVTLPLTGTLATLAGVEVLTNKTLTASGLITANAGISVPTGQNVTGAGTAQVTGFATVSATTLTGTLSTASQTNITGVGTITTGTWTATDIAVADGGTGRSTSTTAYGLIAAGTTATGAHQTLAAGATTDILVGGGAAALPVWTAAQGSGAPVRATSPTLTTPVLGVATATSINKVAITAPASSATLTLADGSTLATSGANSITLTSTGPTTVTLPTTGTLAALGGTNAWSAGNTFVDTFFKVSGSSDATKLVRLEADGLSTATTRVINAPDFDIYLGDGQVIATGRNVAARTNSVTPNTKLDISADELCVRDANGTSKLLSAVSGTINFGATGANGIDTGTQQASTWYYGWVIWNPATATVAVLGSTSSSAPTMPAGYTFKALVTAARSSAATQFLKYRQFGNEVTYEGAQSALSGGAAVVETAISLTALVPPNALRIDFATDVTGSTGAGGAGNVRLTVRLVSGTDLFNPLSHVMDVPNAPSNTVYGYFATANVGQNLYYLLTVTVAVTSPSCSVYVMGFKLPLGGE